MPNMNFHFYDPIKHCAMQPEKDFDSILQSALLNCKVNFMSQYETFTEMKQIVK